jgi:hypothetical protein
MELLIQRSKYLQESIEHFKKSSATDDSDVCPIIIPQETCETYDNDAALVNDTMKKNFPKPTQYFKITADSEEDKLWYVLQKDKTKKLDQSIEYFIVSDDSN